MGQPQLARLDCGKAIRSVVRPGCQLRNLERIDESIIPRAIHRCIGNLLSEVGLPRRRSRECEVDRPRNVPDQVGVRVRALGKGA